MRCKAPVLTPKRVKAVFLPLNYVLFLTFFLPSCRHADAKRRNRLCAERQTACCRQAVFAAPRTVILRWFQLSLYQYKVSLCLYVEASACKANLFHRATCALSLIYSVETPLLCGITFPKRLTPLNPRYCTPD